MPPPGIPDWVFPGAIVQRRAPSGEGMGPLFAIGTMDLHDNLHHLEVYLHEIVPGNPPSLRAPHSEEPGIYLGDLLLFWRPTGDYLYPRGMRELTSTVEGTWPLGSIVELTNSVGETGMYAVTGNQGGNTQIVMIDQREAMPPMPDLEDHQMERVGPPEVDEYYRWEDVVPNAIFTLYIEGIVGQHVEAMCIQTDRRIIIPVADFMAALARGPQDTPPGPSARHLLYRRDLPVPQSYSNTDFQPGDIRVDDDGQEIVLISRTRTGQWLCLAAFDLDEYSDEILETTTLLQQPNVDAAALPPDWDGGMFDQMEPSQAAVFRDLMEDQAAIVPMDSPLAPMSFHLAEQLFNSVRQQDADEAMRHMNPLTRVPMTGFVPLPPSDNVIATPAITEMRCGDRWHFEAPNEGMWFVETITNAYTPGVGNSQTITLRGDDRAIVRGPAEWVVTNGRRVSPPDPRYTGDAIEVGQIWEIATTLTRLPVTRWRVRLLSISSNVPMVSLAPADNPSGAAIYWPEIRLRAQGRYVMEARVRRTAFERILAGDDDGG